MGTGCRHIIKVLAVLYQMCDASHFQRQGLALFSADFCVRDCYYEYNMSNCFKYAAGAAAAVLPLAVLPRVVPDPEAEV